MMTEAELARLFHDLVDVMTAVRLRTQLALGHPACQPDQRDHLEMILQTVAHISPRLQDAYTAHLDPSPPAPNPRSEDN